MTNERTRPYDESMTKAPLTDAYLDLMERRDDPGDYGVCEHNVEIEHERCPDCKWQPFVIDQVSSNADQGKISIVTPEEYIEMRRPK